MTSLIQIKNIYSQTNAGCDQALERITDTDNVKNIQVYILSHEIIQNILSFICIDELYNIKRNLSLNVDIQLYCKYTNIENRYSINEASQDGYTEIIQYLHKKGKDCTNQAMDYASYSGHLDTLKYLHSIGKNCSLNAMDHASHKGYLDIVKYLHSIGKDCTTNAMNHASYNGHLDTLKYLHSIGKTFTTYAMDCAIKHEHTDVINFLKLISLNRD